MSTKLMLVCALAFGTTLGCGQAQNNDDALVDTDDGVTGKADSSKPSGDYAGPADAKIGEFITLSLNDDKTFVRSERGACPGGGTCDPTTTAGTYKFTSGGSSHYIRFTVDGTLLDRYAYKLTGHKLTLRSTADDSTFTMTADTAPVCTGALPRLCKICDDGTTACAHFDASCNIVTCATAPTPPPAPTCSGLLPQLCEVCADGTTECAHFDASCNVVVCPTPPAPVCTGPLPHFCRICSDGSESCAHFDASCNIVTCE